MMGWRLSGAERGKSAADRGRTFARPSGCSGGGQARLISPAVPVLPGYPLLHSVGGYIILNGPRRRTTTRRRRRRRSWRRRTKNQPKTSAWGIRAPGGKRGTDQDDCLRSGILLVRESWRNERFSNSVLSDPKLGTLKKCLPSS